MKQQTASEIINEGVYKTMSIIEDLHNDKLKEESFLKRVELNKLIKLEIQAYAAPFQQTITEHEATIENLASRVVELEGQLSQQSGWVDVKERLPEPKVWVIGYKEGESLRQWDHPIDQRIMYYTGAGEWSGWMKDTGYTFTPTHWQPLPQAPDNNK